MQHGKARHSQDRILPQTSNQEKPCLKDRAKARAKQALNYNSVEDESPKPPFEAAYQELNESPAFNSSKFLNKARIGPSGIPDKVIAFAQGTAEAILHPISAAKRHATKSAAGKLAKSRPYLSQKADLDFLEAHDELTRVEGEVPVGEECDKKRTQDIKSHIKEVEARRQSMRVAWVTSRHVQRVRAVHAIPPPPFPENSFFEKLDEYGYTEFEWGKWLGYKLLNATHVFTAQYIDDFDKLPFNSDTLQRHVERLIIVSAPLQTVIVDIRCIYRWDDPVRTGKWMALYWILWYTSHVMTFFFGYIFYLTIIKYYYPTSLDDLREGIERSLDRGAAAFKVGEMMDEHGSDGWLNPLMEGLGPNIQMHIADFASLLEALDNFYHCRRPHVTLYTLCLIAALFSVSAFGGTEFAMKVWWLIVGCTFFFCFPISSRYPKYRHLVSPWKWMIWDVPTHAEWCFQYLQERAAIAKDAILSATENDDHYIATRKSHASFPAHNTEGSDGSDAGSFMSAESFPLDNERDVISFGCTYLGTPGRLVISTTSLRFESSVGKIRPHGAFDKPYTELIEMSKRQTHASILKPLAKVTTSLDKLELHFRRERSVGVRDIAEQLKTTTVMLENMRGRDKAFNAIIGFSAMRWQSLQVRKKK